MKSGKFKTRKIESMRDNGLRDDEIAKALGVSRSTISYQCPREGIRKSNKLRKGDLLALIQSGIGIVEAADTLGIARSTAYLWLGKDYSGKKQYTRICSVCGKRFKTNNKAQKFCSPKCSRRANKATSEHARRARLNAQIVDKDITLSGLYKRDFGICYICGLKCNPDDYVVVNKRKIIGDWYPTIDHVIPLCKGGPHSWKNVKLAHRKCNSLKSIEDVK